LTEIRSIREGEAETFLDLLCTVFNLDYHRARGIFFTEPLFDLRRKWALFERGEMVSILTTSPLIFGWGQAFGVAGVATRFERRGEGHASRLLGRVFEESRAIGETAGLLFAREKGLYARNGYLELDRVIRAPLSVAGEPIEPESMEHHQVRVVYDAWAEADPARLRRNDARWRYWNWHFRICTPFQQGYICAEPGILREAVYATAVGTVPLAPRTEWFGTRSMAKEMKLSFAAPATDDLHLMGRNFPGVPKLFMTDQF
jgi:hypothetical protein